MAHLLASSASRTCLCSWLLVGLGAEVAPAAPSELEGWLLVESIPGIARCAVSSKQCRPFLHASVPRRNAFLGSDPDALVNWSLLKGQRCSGHGGLAGRLCGASGGVTHPARVFCASPSCPGCPVGTNRALSPQDLLRPGPLPQVPARGLLPVPGLPDRAGGGRGLAAAQRPGARACCRAAPDPGLCGRPRRLHRGVCHGPRGLHLRPPAAAARGGRRPLRPGQAGPALRPPGPAEPQRRDARDGATDKNQVLCFCGPLGRPTPRGGAVGEDSRDMSGHQGPTRQMTGALKILFKVEYILFF